MRQLLKLSLAILLANLALPALAAQSDHAGVVKKLLMSWESGDTEIAASCLHETFLFSFPGGRLDKQGFLALFESYQQEKENIRIYLSDLSITSGGHFITTYQFAATDRETGKRFAVGTGVVSRVQNGRIIELKEYFDQTVAPQQYAGDLPLDEGVVTPWPSSIWLRPETID